MPSNDVSLIGLMVEDFESTTKLNDILHQHRDHIIGRMGLPYAKENLSVICIVTNAEKSKVEGLVEQLQALNKVRVNMMCTADD